MKGKKPLKLISSNLKGVKTENNKEGGKTSAASIYATHTRTRKFGRGRLYPEEKK